MALSRDARLLFIGIISTADDHGRRKATPASFKVELLPMDNLQLETILAWRDEIAAGGLIRIYTDDSGCDILDIPTWTKWQRPKYVADSRLPAYPGSGTIQAEVARDLDQSGPGLARVPGHSGPSSVEWCGVEKSDAARAPSGAARAAEPVDVTAPAGCGSPEGPPPASPMQKAPPPTPIHPKVLHEFETLTKGWFESEAKDDVHPKAMTIMRSNPAHVLAHINSINKSKLKRPWDKLAKVYAKAPDDKLYDIAKTRVRLLVDGDNGEARKSTAAVGDMFKPAALKRGSGDDLGQGMSDS